jgi:para-aminobenzoate synthetase/4-amino-4-deoxychorismate lyase
MNFKTLNNVILHDAASGRWLRFHNPSQVIEINDIAGVAPALKFIESQVYERAAYAAGFLSYEAAPAFDDAFKVHKPKNSFPLLWFGLYRKPDIIPAPIPLSKNRYRVGRWNPSVRFDRYRKNITAIKKLIACGATYQVNYTLRMNALFRGDPLEFFADLVASQQARYPAFVDTGRYAICSASPELFFDLRPGNRLTSRPMKGTAARGLTRDLDKKQAAWLASSEKNRAENIMIVDMVRNDMGRIAHQSSIRASRLFECERFPTVWQMTSTVQCRTCRTVADIIAALFPCASITGAPKVSTMNIIRRLETGSRGIYTGAIGYIAPRRRAQFSVAIRTVVIDKKENRAEYGTGGGITWQSDPAEEYAECLVKAAVLTRRLPSFSLLETMLWTPKNGYFLLDRHLRRMQDSASYFGFSIDLSRIKKKLAAFADSLPGQPHRVRLLAEKNGSICCEAAEIKPVKGKETIRLKLAKQPVDAADCFLYHKTTNRLIYEKELAEKKTCDDVLLYNDRKEITETCTANIVVELDKRLFTPPVSCGLLAGTMRRHCLARHAVEERIILLRDLRRAAAIYTINSVRKWRKAVIGAD